MTDEYRETESAGEPQPLHRRILSMMFVACKDVRARNLTGPQAPAFIRRPGQVVASIILHTMIDINSWYRTVQSSLYHTRTARVFPDQLSSVPIHTQHPSSLVQTHAYSRLGGSCVSFGMLAGVTARIRLAGMAFSFWPSSEDSIGGVIVRGESP